MTAVEQTKDPFEPPKQRPLVVVFSTEDASQYDLVAMLRSKNWEVIVFSDVEKLGSFLQETPRQPDLCLLISIGSTMSILGVCSLFRRLHPNTLFALLSMGISPGDTPSELTREMSLICDGSTNPKIIIESLEKLLQTPLIKNERNPFLHGN